MIYFHIVIFILQVNIIIMIISLVRIYQSKKAHAKMTGPEKAKRDTAK